MRTAPKRINRSAVLLHFWTFRDLFVDGTLWSAALLRWWLSVWCYGPDVTQVYGESPVRSLADVHHTRVWSQRTSQGLVLIRTKTLATDQRRLDHGHVWVCRFWEVLNSQDGCVSAVLFKRAYGHLCGWTRISIDWLHTITANNTITRGCVWQQGWGGSICHLQRHTGSFSSEPHCYVATLLNKRSCFPVITPLHAGTSINLDQPRSLAPDSENYLSPSILKEPTNRKQI